MRTLEVYKVTNKKNGKIYIGITNQGASTNRWYKHCSDSNTGSNFPLHNAIRKYGKDNFQIDIVELIENEDYDYLKEREIFWIKEFDSYNREKGYNLTLGGDGTFGRFHSEETKDKIRKRAIGRHPSLEQRKKMSESQLNRTYSEKELKIRSENGIRTRKKVLQYSYDGVFIREYDSISEAAKEVNTDRRNISSCLNSKNINHIRSAGYIWKYKDKP
jgi:group I intron endonuclease